MKSVKQLNTMILISERVIETLSREINARNELLKSIKRYFESGTDEDLEHILSEIDKAIKK